MLVFHKLLDRFYQLARFSLQFTRFSLNVGQVVIRSWLGFHQTMARFSSTVGQIFSKSRLGFHECQLDMHRKHQIFKHKIVGVHKRRLGFISSSRQVSINKWLGLHQQLARLSSTSGQDFTTILLDCIEHSWTSIKTSQVVIDTVLKCHQELARFQEKMSRCSS